MAIIKEKLDSLPDAPGVYFFKVGSKILYIGKATSLKDRVRSYFSNDIIETRGPKIVKMLELADDITFEATDSVLEALILESRLIKKHQPEYNTREKDNKSYNYIVVTNEDFPRVFTLRQREIERSPEIVDDIPIDEIFGPFPSGNTLREALKILRKIFPFRDKKAKQVAHEYFYRLLKLSPDVSNQEAVEKYQRNIKHLKQFLKGKKQAILKELTKEMERLAKAERFEEAAQIRNQLFALQHIQDVALIKDELVQKKGRVVRIEAFDVAHTAGTGTVGVMTVLTDGEIDKGQYRKFRIKNDKAGSDTHALRELVRRRLDHPEWRLPNIIVADGAVAQKRVVESVLREYGYQIPVVSIKKDERHRPKEILGQKKLVSEYHDLFLLANHEAHRFAIRYHQLLRSKKSLQSK